MYMLRMLDHTVTGFIAVRVARAYDIAAASGEVRFAIIHPVWLSVRIETLFYL